MSLGISMELVQRAVLNPFQNEKCAQLHPQTCNMKAVMQAVVGGKSVSQLYFIVHAIPLLLRFKKLAKNPVQELKKFGIGYGKSMIFVFATLFVIRRTLCLFTQHYKFKNTTAVYSGFLCGFPFLIESPSRRIEMSLVCFTNVLQMIYLILRRRHPWLKIPFGEGWVFAIGIAILCYFYNEDKELFRPTYRKIMDLILKDI